jgi:hypothetical protein
MVARAASLGALCARHLPRWWSALERARGCPEAVEAAYQALPAENFSKGVLEPASRCLAVSPLGEVGWTDVGTPERLHRSLRCRVDPHIAVCEPARAESI